MCRLGPLVLIPPLFEMIVYPHVLRVTYALTLRVLHDCSLILSPSGLKQAVLIVSPEGRCGWGAGGRWAGAAGSRERGLQHPPTIRGQHRTLRSWGLH